MLKCQQMSQGHVTENEIKSNFETILDYPIKTSFLEQNILFLYHS